MDLLYLDYNSQRQGPTDSLLQTAKKLSAGQSISAKDALHVAAALESGALCFVSCDDRLS